ncbi:PRC-barrel domain-containing protein [Streptomyces sp. SCSIO 30461]|uniref:PRC-barrel domain-containing protein n=1 Tax=Streptomyces sp. SCSIO 30461 TaxID=3118085 RepID=UPI0030CD9041
MEHHIWTHSDASGHRPGTSLVGFTVEAAYSGEGSIGTIGEHAEDVGRSYIVVDTGHWIFTKHALLPARIITRVDADERIVYVDCTKKQIREAPPYGSPGQDPIAMEQFSRHYGTPHS